MKSDTDNASRLNILGRDDRSSNMPGMLKQWRQRMGYFSIFAAIPAILPSQSQEVHAEEIRGPEFVAAPAPNRIDMLSDRCGKSKLLGRRSDYLLSHQKGKFDIVSEFSGGSDTCPGTPIPGGRYTAAAPFTDLGDTRGADDTLISAPGCFFYSASYQSLRGPDLVYSFTLTGRGVASQIKLTSGTVPYNPAVYILDGRSGQMCPAGPQASANNCLQGASPFDTGGAGSVATITAEQINTLPLNVPLYLFVDCYSSPCAGGGPYTLRMQDVTISPASPTSKKFDFDADGRADISVFRPSDRTWYLKGSNSNLPATQFGLPTDQIVPADFDGDQKTDIAVYRDGLWLWLNSSNGAVRQAGWGVAGDMPQPADYTGDGRAELAVYRGGTWFTYDIATGLTRSVQFGLPTDRPVPADYDGDERTDFAVYRDGVWYLQRSAQGFKAVQFGIPSDKLILADYDGDAKADLAVFRDGTWYVQRSLLGFTAFQFGAPADTPVPADYDGNGSAEAAVFRNGVWYLRQDTGAFSAIAFGLATDQPLPAAYLP